MFVAEFREDIRVTISAIVEHLNHHGVPKATIEAVSSLAAQGMC